MGSGVRGAITVVLGATPQKEEQEKEKQKPFLESGIRKKKAVMEARTAAAVAAKNIPSPEVSPLEKFQKRERQDRGAVFTPQSTAPGTLGMEGDQGTSQIRQGC